MQKVTMATLTLASRSSSHLLHTLLNNELFLNFTLQSAFCSTYSNLYIVDFSSASRSNRSPSLCLGLVSFESSEVLFSTTKNSFEVLEYVR